MPPMASGLMSEEVTGTFVVSGCLEHSCSKPGSLALFTFTTPVLLLLFTTIDYYTYCFTTPVYYTYCFTTVVYYTYCFTIPVLLLLFTTIVYCTV